MSDISGVGEAGDLASASMRLAWKGYRIGTHNQQHAEKSRVHSD